MTTIAIVKLVFIIVGMLGAGGFILYLKNRLKKGDKAIKNEKVLKESDKINTKISSISQSSNQEKEDIRNEANKIKNKPVHDNVSAADNLNSLPK